jgi:hypothetical protein
MKRRGALKIILILTQCRPPTPVAAAVEFVPGVGADADQPAIKELVAAFNEGPKLPSRRLISMRS